LAKTKPRSSISIYHPQTPKGKINHAVDIVAHPKGGEEGYVLELFNEVEESVNVVIVPKSAIQEEEKEGSSLLGMIRYRGIN